MSATLRLEYVCTRAEMEEAESLHLHQQLGRGSKWRTHVILFAFLVVAFTLLYFQLRLMVSPPYRPYVYTAIALFIVGFVLWRQYRKRHRKYGLTRVEVTSAEMTVLGPDTRFTFPWSAFSDCLESPNLFVLVDRTKSVLLMLPKRAFPDENWQTWFRELAHDRPHPALQPSPDTPVMTGASSPDQITVWFRLRYRDYLDRALASWRTWTMVLLFVAAILGASLYAFAHPDPHPVNPPSKVFFAFELPFLAVLLVMMIFLLSVHDWWVHRKYLVQQEVALSEESVSLAGGDGTGQVPWSAYDCYKETRWSFVVWRWRRRAWFMLPKRAFASADDVQCCRALLSRKLRASRWFFG